MIVNRGIDKINLGDFVQKAVLLEPQQSRNSRGAINNEWIEQCPIFGKLTINAVDEAMLDQNIVNQDRIEFVTYVRGDVTSEYRLQIENILYGITSVTRLLNQPLMVIKAEKISER